MTNAVIDASVLVRATIDDDRAALGWLRAVESGQIRGLAPELVWAEYSNALTQCVRHAVVTVGRARGMLEDVLRLSLTTLPIAELALAAFTVSVARGLSAYDASYVVLAEAHDATIVTADRRLAAAYDRVEVLA